MHSMKMSQIQSGTEHLPQLLKTRKEPGTRLLQCGISFYSKLKNGNVLRHVGEALRDAFHRMVTF